MKCNRCIHSKSCIVSATCRTVEECTRFESTGRCADCEYCISKYTMQCGRTICRLHDALVNVNNCCEQFVRKGVNEK